MPLHTDLISSNPNTLKQEALKICAEYLGTPWDNITVSDFEISRLSGGFMNKLYRCSLVEGIHVENSKTPREVMLRIFGALQEDEGTALTQNTTFMLLAERKLGPKLYGVFPKGRLEEYIPSRILTAKEVRQMSTTIAREMAKIHVLDVPVKKHPHQFVDLMKSWLSGIEKERIEKCKEKFPLSNFFTEELEWLQKEMDESGSPVVFCHNDVHGGNILLRDDSRSEDEPNLVIIDFELACYQYRGFDIALYLTEWVFEYGLPDKPYFSVKMENYPSKKERIDFIEAYLNQLVLEGGIQLSSLETEKYKILSEIKLFSLMCHLYVALWAETMMFRTPSELDYPVLSDVRRRIYKMLKEKYLQNKLNS